MNPPTSPMSVIICPASEAQEEEWDQFVDTPEEHEDEPHHPQQQQQQQLHANANVTTSSCSTRTAFHPSSSFSFPQVPPQLLHPAVSLAVQRVSSCYLLQKSEDENMTTTNTTTSIADLLSLLDNNNNTTNDNNNDSATDVDYDIDTDPHQEEDASNVLYHDILMHVFTFLNAPSLATFSETARRPNFEVFYYLQLQLQRSLLVDHHTLTTVQTPVVTSSSFGGSACVSRYASLRPTEAQQIVVEFGDSNSTLRTMPLSHSLAYLRHVLQRGLLDPHQQQQTTLAGAALFVTVVGAAFLGGASSGAGHVESAASFGTELPNMLFRVGLTMGGIMGAAKAASKREMAQRLPKSFWNDAEKDHPSLARLMHALSTIMPVPNHSGNSADADNQDPTQQQQQQQRQQPWTPNPYEHLPSDYFEEEKKEDDPQPTTSTTTPIIIDKKMPSGCVGAYSQAIIKAANGVTQYVKDQRQAKFDALSMDEQYQLSTRFLEACTSNDTLPLVKVMIHSMNVDGFFLGSDGGTETCALHTAAFHGAHQVLDFLCQRINISDPTQDGGLATVNSKDINGWTALHFAAGANSVETVQVLVKHHGALLHMEANNGYTPLQWAQRLSNTQVAKELLQLYLQRAESSPGWIMQTMSSSRQPLSMIANRFFSLIPPTH